MRRRRDVDNLRRGISKENPAPRKPDPLIPLTKRGLSQKEADKMRKRDRALSILRKRTQEMRARVLARGRKRGRKNHG